MDWGTWATQDTAEHVRVSPNRTDGAWSLEVMNDEHVPEPGRLDKAGLLGDLAHSEAAGPYGDRTAQREPWRLAQGCSGVAAMGKRTNATRRPGASPPARGRVFHLTKNSSR